MRPICSWFFFLSCAILMILWTVQFTGCAQVDQAKTSLANQIAFENGNKAMANEDYDLAADQYRKAAAAGNAEAAYYLGLLASGGGNLPINEQEAFQSMHMSAEKGYGPAQKLLGMWHMKGDFAPKDPAKAIYWFNKAADQGDRSAMFFLGTMCAKGQGVPRDYDTALGWFQMARAKGFPVKPELLTLEGVAAFGRKFDSAPAAIEKSTLQDRPATVRNVQDGLTRLGYKPGPVDGMMGKKTANAIRAFQRDVDMPVDGKVSDALMHRIDEQLNQ